MLSLVPWLVLGLNDSLRSSRWHLMTFLTLQNIGSAMADVVVDAMIAEAVRFERYMLISTTFSAHFCIHQKVLWVSYWSLFYPCSINTCDHCGVLQPKQIHRVYWWLMFIKSKLNSSSSFIVDQGFICWGPTVSILVGYGLWRNMWEFIRRICTE